MSEPPYLCTTCALEASGPEELARHVQAVHAPEAVEPDVELARRLRAYEHALERKAEEQKERGAHVLSDNAALEAMLSDWRLEAAASIAARNTENLGEVAIELDGAARLLEVLAQQMTLTADRARADAETCRRVIDILREPVP